MPKRRVPDPNAPLRIEYVQGLDPPPGLALYTNRLALAEELVPIVFPTSNGELPSGAYLDHAGTSFVEFHLVVRGPAFWKLERSLKHSYLAPAEYGGTRLAAMQSLERQRREEAEGEKWWRTFHPILGMSPAKRLATPGWWKRKGYFVWAGSDPHLDHPSLQWERLSQYESVNDQVEYYLKRGDSLRDAIKASIDMDHAQLNAAAIIGASPAAPIGIQILERQMMLDDARLYRNVSRILEADLREIEIALRQFPTED